MFVIGEVIAFGVVFYAGWYCKGKFGTFTKMKDSIKALFN